MKRKVPLTFADYMAVVGEFIDEETAAAGDDGVKNAFAAIERIFDRLTEEKETLLAALWPFAMNYQIGSGYSRDDFKRASEAMGKLPISDE